MSILTKRHLTTFLPTLVDVSLWTNALGAAMDGTEPEGSPPVH